MNSNWRPDDSFLDTQDGEQAGVRRIREVLRKHGLELGQILTSQDKGMEQVINELERSRMPPGLRQWQLPVPNPPQRRRLRLATRAPPSIRPARHVTSHDQAIFFPCARALAGCSRGAVTPKLRSISPGSQVPFRPA